MENNMKKNVYLEIIRNYNNIVNQLHFSKNN